MLEKNHNISIIFSMMALLLLSCSKKDTNPVIIVPSAPTNIQATAGDGKAIISFSPPVNNGGANIISYTVISNPGNISAAGVQSPITITGLTNGISYTFRVVASNSAGIGEYSIASNSVTPASIAITSKNCSILSISRFNNGSQSDYAMTVIYDFVNRPIKLILYDSLKKVKDYEANLSYQSDAIVIDQYQRFTIDPTTQQIKSFSTKENLADPKSDNLLYEYLYNDSGYLITKNQFINNSSKPIYTTKYTYNNNLLTSCIMVLASTNQKVLESTITYETSKLINNFIYNFPDGFESFKFSPLLNYGAKMRYPVKSMITKIYDPSKGTLLDTWTSNYSNYTYSADNTIIQGTHTGEYQQGFGLFYGKTVFNYSCK